jgi:hypothetical protein
MKTIVCFGFLLLVLSAANAQVTTDSSTASKILKHDTSANKAHWGLGISVGTPAGVNAILEASGKRFFGRVTGLMLPTLAGIQLEYGYFVTGTRRTNIGLSVIAAASDSRYSGIFGGSTHATWSGVGFAASTTLSGFFLQGGITWGEGGVTQTSGGLFFFQTVYYLHTIFKSATHSSGRLPLRIRQLNHVREPSARTRI